ncbi:hypothetical protein IC235_06490 [Hymenobacter sp. BT664]|uniref:Uncharacterized protein n=1 Tax=Hymenobacter montanus TaxID=2771359 RepID=A0A927BCG9_9BACT|nr:Imm8 family immunity protein [Hymenobacter montanus]MBD2767537.1 hypothetical protein [Hymenobacter montanus]
MKNNIEFYGMHADGPCLKRMSLEHYKPDLAKPFYFNLEISVRYLDLGVEDAIGSFSVIIANPTGITEYYQNEIINREIVFGEKVIIFKENYSHESLHQFIENLVNTCNGRNSYESTILLLRFFESVDFSGGPPNGDYYLLFDKIKQKDSD